MEVTFVTVGTFKDEPLKRKRERQECNHICWFDVPQCFVLSCPHVIRMGELDGILCPREDVSLHISTLYRYYPPPSLTTQLLPT